MKLLDLIHVNADDIKDLNEYESAKLLDKLFRYELDNNSLEVSCLTFSSDPKIKDQGIDAVITKSLPAGLNILPAGISIFQFKASKQVFNVKKEFCKKFKVNNEWYLKPLLKEFLEKGATYVLINTKEVWNYAQKEERKKKIKNKLNEIDSELEFPIEIYSADDIARWCDKYPIFRIHFNKLLFAKIFNDWQEEIFENRLTKIISTDTIKTLIFDFLKKLRMSEEKPLIFRIFGAQGIGKKTFLIETLKKLPENQKSNIIIIDSKINKIEDISNTLYCFSVTSGILVILNCSDKCHNEISDRLNSSKMKDIVLITLNSQIYMNKSKIFKGTEIIEIPKWNDKDIEELIKEIDPNIPYHIQSQIIKYSEGIPDFILSIYTMLKNKDYELYKLDNIEEFSESLMEYLIKDSHFNQATLTRVLLGFSLFSSLGWKKVDYKEYTSEGIFAYKFERNKEKFCWILGLEGKLYEVEHISTYLLERRILRMRGRFIYINLRPLAIFLLKKYESKIMEFFEKIQALNDNHFLKRFLERLEDFSYEDIGKKIVSIILQNDYFNDWRNLNDQKVANIILQLSKINNKLIAEKLDDLFKKAEYDDLRENLTSRRELIYALQHVIWEEETFEEGMNVLLKLAIAENENYANNATGIFCERFPIYLPDTSTPLNNRMNYLKKLNQSDDKRVILQLLNALTRVFSTKYYSKTIYAEIQGFKPLGKEYVPKSREEIFTYIKDGFELLKKQLKSSILEVRNKSFEILNNTQNITLFLNLGLWGDIKYFWSEFINIDDNNKFKILDIIGIIIHREKSRIENIKTQIKNGINNPQFKSSIKDSSLIHIIEEIETIFRLKKEKIKEFDEENYLNALIDDKVKSIQQDFSELEKFEQEIKASFKLLDEIQWALKNVDHWFSKDLNYDEYMENQGKKIAQKIYTDTKEINLIIKFLITRDYYLVFFIGWEFAKLDDNFEKWSLIKEIFIENKDSRKTEFIRGYLTDYRMNEPKKYNHLIDEIKNQEGLTYDLYDFAIRRELDDWSIDLIIELYENKIIETNDFLKFAHPHPLNSLERDQVKKLINFYFKQVKNPLDVGKDSFREHLFILEDYFKKNKDFISEIKDLLMSIIISFENFEDEEVIDSEHPLKIPRHLNLSRFWKELVILFIEEFPDTIIIIRKKILDNLPKFPTLVSQPDIQELFIKFLELDKEGTWRDFEEKFTDESDIHLYYQFYFNFEFLFKIPEEWIIGLCKKDSENYPLIITKMFDENIRQFESPPSLMVKLIENFYENKKLRYELINSFESGVRMFLPGRSSGIVNSYIKILENWNKKSSSIKFKKWIYEAIQYLTDESKRLKIWDEEEFLQTQDTIEKDDFYNKDDFYKKENWLNSIKDKYIGKTIAFTNIEGKWIVLASSSDEDELFKQLEKLHKKKEINKKYKVRFRKF